MSTEIVSEKSDPSKAVVATSEDDVHDESVSLGERAAWLQMLDICLDRLGEAEDEGDPARHAARLIAEHEAAKLAIAGCFDRLGLDIPDPAEPIGDQLEQLADEIVAAVGEFDDEEENEEG